MAIVDTGTTTTRPDLGIAAFEYTPTNEGFIADRVLPVVGVSRKASTFTRIAREDMLKVENTKRSTGGHYQRIGLKVEEDSYACIENGLEEVLGDDDRALYDDQFEVELAHTLQLTHKIQLTREQEVAAAILNTTTWTGSALYTDVKANPWSTVGTGVIAQVSAAGEIVRKNCGQKPNALILSAAAATRLTQNTGIRSAISGVEALTIDHLLNRIGAIIGVPNLIVGGQIYDSAKEGQSFVSADIWSDKYALLAYLVPPGSLMKTAGLGRTFLWTDDSPDMLNVEQYRENQSRGDVFRVRHTRVEKIFDPYYAHLLRIET